jgi:hypothetical protein
MLAITPGPRVLRRHDGQWLEDPAWVGVLKSVRPPKIVKLTEPQVASVTTQVDRATDQEDWEPFDADSREQYQIFTASAYLQELQNETDERALFSLVAVAGRELSPADVKNTERLKRYWTVGEGAAKIRWGTPGSWRRCYRHLVKYVGPKVAPGLCTNLGQRLGGPGIATHVGKVKPIPGSAEEGLTAANPSGVNGYDKGKTFEQSTGGVERDYHGRFSTEGGSNRSERRKRRDASVFRRKKAREDKESKKSGSTAKKAASEAKRAREAAESEQLANLSLQIAEAVAAGDSLRAAELRVQRAERALAFADTPTEKINAQTALVNARAALARARRSKGKRKIKGPGKPKKKDPVEGFYKDHGRYPNEDELNQLADYR